MIELTIAFNIYAAICGELNQILKHICVISANKSGQTVLCTYTFDWNGLNELRTMGNDIWNSQFKRNELHCVCARICVRNIYAYIRLFTLSIKTVIRHKRVKCTCFLFSLNFHDLAFSTATTANHVSYGNRFYVPSVVFGRCVLRLLLLPHW